MIRNSLDTLEAQEGSYIHQSLGLLFEMVFRGVTVSGEVPNVNTFTHKRLNSLQREAHHITPLDSGLFDPENTWLIEGREGLIEGRI
jgi:hypothetical protein